ncbi:serine acetyltransferase [Bradyrhizobium sp. SZCCHNR2009]|uniref:serine acetyltransferase n=2 Tax=Bradyrhizobium TaxID=374 RepID=UPI0028F0D39F|nr:serine acetyltransferase [Bradyrhizobium sp. SZCCHNR2009]
MLFGSSRRAAHPPTGIPHSATWPFDMMDRTLPEISADIADWSREQPRQFWDPGRKLLLAIRNYQAWRARRGLLPKLLCKLAVLRHRFWSVVTGADIPLTCRIGGGLLIPHPNGIVIHPAAEIGVNCLIFQQVTIGSREGPGVPLIGGHVDIGAGAKILGALTIGNHARIGANAVVITDVGPGQTAVGLIR